MSSRPRTSGRSTSTCRSKRPGRSRAGSSTSGRLVAAMMMMPLRASKPSISASSWFSVCSRSSWPPIGDCMRALPSASSSSMKTMQGALTSACANRSRTRAAPTPTNISTNSEPVREKKGTPASPATARASSVLPVPGGPTSSTPLGMRPPMRVYFSGVLRNSTISRSSSSASSTPATSAKPHLHIVVRVDLGLAAGKRHHAAFSPAHAAEEDAPERDDEDQRDDPAEHLADPAAGDLAGVLHAVGRQVLDQLGVLDPHRDEVLAVLAGLLQDAAHAVLRDRDLLDLAVAHERLEVAVGERVPGLRRVVERLAEREQQDEAEDHPGGRRRARPRRHPAIARAFALRGRVGRLFRHAPVPLLPPS